MWFRRSRGRRRGGTLVVGVVGLVGSLTTVGVSMDAGRLFVSRHRDQIISDSATMAATQKLPNTTQATTAADRVFAMYRNENDLTFTSTLTFTTDGNGLATAVRANIAEEVPMFLPGVMGTATRSTATRAAAARTIPSAILQGLVPLGIQYNTTFDIPTNGYASPTDVTLKRGSGSDNTTKGNFGALRFPGDNSGSSQWSAYLKYGYTDRYEVGDTVTSKPGNMSGPTTQALSSDTDSRFNRASAYPYSEDTYDNFHPGNPRIIVVPLVDWTGANGTSSVPIKGFAAFYVMSTDKGDITGRFVRYTINKKGGPGWDGISIDPTESADFDGGLWSANMVE